MTKHNHTILFVLLYLGMPALLAWLGYEFSGFETTVKKEKQATENSSVYKNAAGSAMAFYDLPRVSLSMASSTGSNGIMKLDLSLQVPQWELKRVVDFEPRIIEKILLFMRQQSFEQFQQPNGARDLRRDLEHEIRTGAFPIQIAAINVREMVFE